MASEEKRSLFRWKKKESPMPLSFKREERRGADQPLNRGRVLDPHSQGRKKKKKKRVVQTVLIIPGKATAG